MTNEEIRKRFEFDLKMGLFKNRSRFAGGEFRFCGYLEDSIKFLNLLIDSGYLCSMSEDTFKNMIRTYNSADTEKLCKIDIVPSDKIVLSVNRSFEKEDNPFPDYIKEYKVSLNNLQRKVIRFKNLTKEKKYNYDE